MFGLLCSIQRSHAWGGREEISNIMPSDIFRDDSIQVKNIESIQIKLKKS